MNERMNEWMDIILGHIDVDGSNLKALKDPVGKDHVETVSKTSPKIQRRCRDDQDEDEDAVDDNSNLINLQFDVFTIENEPSPSTTINWSVLTINNGGCSWFYHINIH